MLGFIMTRTGRAFYKALILGGMLCTFAGYPANAQNGVTELAQRSVTIFSDKGGILAKYAIKTIGYRDSNTMVRIRGRCDSACTLYLSMPYPLLCLRKGASFGFHMPYGGSRASNLAAANYLLERYPQWVRDWIEQNGGLSGKIKRMDYEHARMFVRECDDEGQNWLAGLW